MAKPLPRRRTPTPPAERDAFVKVRILGIRVIIGIVVFVAVGDFIDDVVFGNLYHPDATFYAWVTGLAVTFVTGVALQRSVATRENDEDEDGPD